MKCPYCGGDVELPEAHYPAFCVECDKWFHKAEEHGWWDVVVEVYVPTVNGES